MRTFKTKNVIFLGALFLILVSNVSSITPAVLADESEFDFCDADLNADGSVNMVDVVMFADDFYAPDAPTRSDFNGDGVIDLSDVVLFVAALGANEC